MGHHERLSALDAAFLAWETPEAHMHIACTMVLERGPLATEDGGVDFEALRKSVAGALARIPRYRQKLVRVPLEGGLAWVDDDRFSLDYHLRHTALPRPGGREQLAALTSWIMQQPLDRSRPLWEMWVVEGLSENRFAVVSKVHHCMVDGIAGVELMQRMLSPDPKAAPFGAAVPSPRAAPSSIELLAGAAWRRAAAPLEILTQLRPFELVQSGRDVLARVGGFLGAAARTLRPASPTPWNGRLGPHRRFESLAMELADVRAVSRRFGATVNDVVLATVAGAVRRDLQRRGHDLREVRFRVLAPVSVRDEEERGALGNRVSLWVIDLPVDQADPRRRLARIRRQTAELKRSRSALGAKLLAEVAEWTSSTLLSLGAQAAMQLPAFNAIVTNVPGPQIPLYLAGARLLEAYPVAPLFDNVCLNVALISYGGRLFWGLNADYDRAAELAALRADLEVAFAELQRAEPAGRGRRRVGG